MRVRELAPPSYRVRTVDVDDVIGRQVASPQTLAVIVAALPVGGGRLDSAAVEYFGVLMLDTKRRITAFAILGMGTLDGCLVHPREVFRAAIVAQASAVLVFHNHPSGDPAPSGDDSALTIRLAAAGVHIGIDVLDHCIVGAEGRYFSFKEQGVI